MKHIEKDPSPAGNLVEPDANDGFGIISGVPGVFMKNTTLFAARKVKAVKIRNKLIMLNNFQLLGLEPHIYCRDCWLSPAKLGYLSFTMYFLYV